MAESFLGIPKPLSDYGKRGKDVASAFSSGSLGYHLEQLSMDDRNLLKRNNNFDFDAFLKREGGNSTVKAIKSILEKTGDNIQKGKIPPAAIIDHLTKVDLKINDKTEPISKELAWGILRWSNYLAESKRKNNNFKIAAGVVLTATLAGGALIAHHKNDTPESSQTKPTQTEQVDLPTSTTEVAPTITRTPIPFTPEPTFTPNPEQQMAAEWNKILNDHKKSGLALIGGIIISDENLIDPDGFRKKASAFIETNDMFHGTNQVILRQGEPTETDLSIERSVDGLIMVRIDGNHAMGPNEANAMVYNPTTGECSAMSIDLDGNRNILNSTPPGQNGPESCIAMAHTTGQDRIVIEFQPSGGDVLIKGAIFQADIK